MSGAGLKFWKQTDKNHAVPAEAGRFGMILFLISIGMLFGATIAGFLVIRYTTENWSTGEQRGLPVILWFTTVILLASSVPLHRALVAVRRDDPVGPGRGMTLGTGLGFLFLLGQGVAWYQLVAGLDSGALKTQYVFTFYMLTVTHALHVVGGLIPMILVTWRARRGLYSRIFHPGILYCNMYWHFLTGVWVVLFVVLLVFA